MQKYCFRVYGFDSARKIQTWTADSTFQTIDSFVTTCLTFPKIRSRFVSWDQWSEDEWIPRPSGEPELIERMVFNWNACRMFNGGDDALRSVFPKEMFNYHLRPFCDCISRPDDSRKSPQVPFEVWADKSRFDPEEAMRAVRASCGKLTTKKTS